MPMMKPLKNIVKELREIGDGISNMYRNNNNKNNNDNVLHHHHHHHHHRHGKSHIAPECSSPISSSSSSPSQSSVLSASSATRCCSSSAMAARRDQSRWANLPPELLMDIIKRVEVTETSWPSRRAVVACASVCRTWRHITKALVDTPEQCGWITFPISLKQPGPRDTPIQCFIKRERVSSTYRLYLGLSPALSGDMSKLLLAAKKIRKATCTEFLISLVADDFSRSSTTYIGKLRSNFLGTKFMILDGQPSLDPPSIRSSSKSQQRVHLKQVLPRAASSCANYNVATVSYELNVLRTRGPRRMRCSMHLIPLSAIQEGGTAPTPLNFTNFFNDLECTTMSLSKSKNPGTETGSTSTTITTPDSSHCSRESSLVLRNKAPRWHEQLQCWCLNFKGRVTVASVKNFQLVAAVEPTQNNVSAAADQEKVILQFGKIGKDIFTMDYRYPLSAFQAFAICLSSFDTKPACE